MVAWLQTQYKDRIQRLSACCEALDEGSYGQLAAFRRLQHEVLATERRTTIRLRNQGIINDEVLHRIERELDLEEARLGS
jgi:CPA1 family monovalent cation:H+ antiporter